MATCIRRRELIAVLGGTAVAWPLAVRAQQSKRIPRIGVLLFGTPDTDPNLPAFLQGLRELRYVEGQNITIEYRYAEGKPDRLRCGRAGCNQARLNIRTRWRRSTLGKGCDEYDTNRSGSQ